MKPMNLNLKQMKKIKEDQNSASFLHPSGHEIVIAKTKLQPLHRKQIESLPLHLAEGTPDAPIPDKDDSGDYFKSFKNTLDDGGLGSKISDGYDSVMNAIRPQIVTDALNRQQGIEPAPNDMTQQAAPQLPASMPQQMPTQDPQMAAQPNPAMGPMSAMAQTGASLQEAYNQGQRAIDEQQKVDSMKAQEQEKVMANDLAQRQQLSQNFESNQKALMDQQKAFLSDLQSEHINPRHYQESMTSGQKVSTAIGLFLGGLGQGLIGGTNPAMDMLNKQIDRDIESQRASMDKRKTLFAANQSMLQDNTMAYNATKMNMNDIYDRQMQMQAAKLGTPQAKAAANMAHSKYAMENVHLLQQNALRQTILQKMNGSGVGGKETADPAQLVPLMVPEAHQKEVFGEISRAQDTRRMGKSIIDAFNKATKENTLLKTGGGKLRTPPSVYALHQAMQPTFKDLEGTVRQAAMDNTFTNITPMPGDFESTIKEKRQALMDYLQSKASAPTAKGFGIDLGRFESTAPMSGQNSMEGKTATGPNGQKIIMKNGKWVPLG